MKRILLLALSFGVAAVAQQPRVENAKLQTRSAAGGLEREFRTLTTSQEQPAWLGYAVPVVSGRHNSCCWSPGGACGCRLEGGTISTAAPPAAAAVKLEDSTHLLVLFRVEQRKVGKIRTFAEDCPLDAGGLPFIWLTDVRPPESVALLSGFAAGDDGSREGGRLSESALGALALHPDPAADRVLEQFTAADRPERLRERAVFALSQLPKDEGVPLLIQVAKNNHDAAVRKQAFFWLGQSKDPRALAFFEEILAAAK